MERGNPTSTLVVSNDPPQQTQLERKKLRLSEATGGSTTSAPTAAGATNAQGVLYRLVKINPDGSYTAVSEDEAAWLLQLAPDTDATTDTYEYSDASSSDDEEAPPFDHRSMTELKAEEHRLLEKMHHLNDLLSKFEEEDRQRQAQVLQKCAPGFPSVLRDSVGGSPGPTEQPPRPNGVKVGHASKGATQGQKKQGAHPKKGGQAESRKGGGHNAQVGSREGNVQQPRQAGGGSNNFNRPNVEKEGLGRPSASVTGAQGGLPRANKASFLDGCVISRKRKRGTTRPRRDLSKLLVPLREAARQKTGPPMGARTPQGTDWLSSQGGGSGAGGKETHDLHRAFKDDYGPQAAVLRKEGAAQGPHPLASKPHDTPSPPPLPNGFEGFGVDSAPLLAPGSLAVWGSGKVEDFSFIKAFDLNSLDSDLCLDQAWEEGLNRADLELGDQLRLSSPRKSRDPSGDHLDAALAQAKLAGRLEEDRPIGSAGGRLLLEGGEWGVGDERPVKKKQKTGNKPGPQSNGGSGKQGGGWPHQKSGTSGNGGREAGTKAMPNGAQHARWGGRETVPASGLGDPSRDGSFGQQPESFGNQARRPVEAGVDILSWPGPYPQQAGSYPPLDLGKPFARPAAKRSKLVAVHKSKQSREASAGNENRVPGGLAGQSIGKTKLQKGDPQYDKRAGGSDWGSGGEARGHEEGLPRAGKVTDWGDGIGRSGSGGGEQL